MKSGDLNLRDTNMGFRSKRWYFYHFATDACTKCLVLQVVPPTFASPTHDSIAAAPQAQTYSGVPTLHLQSLVSTLTFASLTHNGLSLVERLQDHLLAQIECFKLDGMFKL